MMLKNNAAVLDKEVHAEDEIELNAIFEESVGRRQYSLASRSGRSAWRI